ncbi:hypothetical protein LptCag_1499 [Leptospirillum ferriphilum]|uniref:Uncharacterized protein n=1 Tax=Leptospirillum ferriphilum TaxID=178606 RepID=A0A094X5F9_9BACT|nr:hypothetical protein [Leptospirillum ferriphilum]KGA93789.1 hypothetical protein LptCag_1499 [Leptospirillum ferriphilum]
MIQDFTKMTDRNLIEKILGHTLPDSFFAKNENTLLNIEDVIRSLPDPSSGEILKLIASVEIGKRLNSE